MAGKVPGPPPAAARRRVNKDTLKPMPQGTRRGRTAAVKPHPMWRTDVRNYFNSVLNSGQVDWMENSDVMVLYLQCEMLDKVLRGQRTEPLYERAEVTYEKADGSTGKRWEDVLDDDGNKIPILDQFGEHDRRVVGSVNGPALKAILDLGSELLVTEGSRRRLRIDLGSPPTDEEPREKAIVAQQRAQLAKVS